ncbi:hypothetical protein ACFUJR_25365 [Streptomyces sp. NPDC057271]|uniref:hypothetical protein n=1 Tax=unclassified Streptomyces TaxID=2593676 RepID=UPI0036387511
MDGPRLVVPRSAEAGGVRPTAARAAVTAVAGVVVEAADRAVARVAAVEAAALRAGSA